MIRHALTYFLQAGILLTSLIGSTAGAANLTVTTLDDSGPGSLRQAIELANSTPDADTITFSVSGTITLDSTLPAITDPAGLTIDGTGNSITVSGNKAVRVMIVNSGATLNLEHLTVANGYAAEGSYDGGGIVNNGTVTVTNSIFFGNSAAYYGGGIVNSGTVTVTNSTFSGNSTFYYSGGGIVNIGTVTVTNSTFSDNKANAAGGGIHNFYAGTITITNSTFSGNSANAAGGGISNIGTITITDSTFSGNSAIGFGGFGGTGGGISSDHILNLANTILANSKGGADCTNAGTLNATGINLVEDGSCGATSDSVHFITGDPLLGPLADNGGPTETLALLPGSPAIDTADDTICAAPPVNSLDQRGVMRPQGAHCDIGAFELIQSTPPSIEPIIIFFDQAVGNGGLIGSGPGNSAPHRLTALRHQLLTAGTLINQNDIPQACEQLKASLKRIHTGGPIENSQFVTGADASVLVQKIQTLQYDLGCSQ